jgi:hypothetical protein
MPLLFISTSLLLKPSSIPLYSHISCPFDLGKSQLHSCVMLDLPAELLPQTDEDKFLKQKWKTRWECLKPVIVKLYTGNYGKNGKPATIDEIAAAMRRHYSFHAAYVPESKAMPIVTSYLPHHSMNPNKTRDSASEYPH